MSRFRVLVAAGVVGIAAAASLAAVLWLDAGGPSRAAAAPRAQPLAQAARPEPLLAVRRPLLRGPKVAARAAILVDAETGTVLWAKRPHRRLPIASTTKIMTAVLALEHLHPRDVVTVHPSVPRVAPYREGLRAGERVPSWKLLYGLMLYSGNDDALALAIATAGSRPAFVELMNRKARELGLRRTHFSTPSGVVDRDNRSTAWDLAALARYAMAKPAFRTIVRAERKRVRWSPPTFEKLYVNKNRLLRTYPGADGIKTGWTTRAGHCLVASATRHGIRLIAVVLDSPDVYRDARTLFNIGFQSRG